MSKTSETKTAGSPTLTPTLAPTLAPTLYLDRPAFRLSDGVTEAIIVPSIGRVMFYGFVNGPNLLWNAPDAEEKLAATKIAAANPNVWMNWGGDKTWPAPQRLWPLASGVGWPPPEAWDNAPHRAEILPHARLRTTSPIAKGLLGARIIREYGFNAQGELEINQIAEKLRGAPLMLSIWSITQTQPDAVYLPSNPRSPYKNNFMFFGKPRAGASIEPISPSLLRVRPLQVKPGAKPSGYKIGLDAPVAAIIAVKGEVAFRLQSERQDGQYPDGADDAGFPVELYDTADPNTARNYIELELLGPLRPFRAGSRWQQTMKWSLHHLPSNTLDAPATVAAIKALMPKPPPPVAKP